jgi:capsular polysaccharide biosynthesis protein
MNLTDFVQMLLRRGWIAVVLALVFAAAGYGYARTRTPVYEATTPVKLQPARPADLGQTQAIKEVMRSFQQDIKTFDMAEAVRVRLCGDPGAVATRLCATRDAGALRDMIQVAADANVYEIQIKARTEDPAEAVKVSEQTADAFVDQRDKANLQLDLNTRILAEVRDAPQPVLYSPRKKLIVGAAGALGLLLGACLVLIIEYLVRAVVRNAHDAERLLGTSVLGAVPPVAGGRRRGGALTQGVRDLVGPAARWARLAVPVLGLAALGVLAAYAFSRVQPTVYVARTRIAVEPALSSDWGRSQAIREIARGFSRDIHTRHMAEAVSERLQLDEPPDALLERVNVAEDVDIYEITVEARDADEAVARDISRTWAEQFVEERRTANLELDQQDRILVRLRDRTLSEVWAPKTRANVLAGAVLGALVGAALSYLLHVLGAGVIRTGGDAAGTIGAPVLGAIPPARPRG